MFKFTLLITSRAGIWTRFKFVLFPFCYISSKYIFFGYARLYEFKVKWEIWVIYWVAIFIISAKEQLWNWQVIKTLYLKYKRHSWVQTFLIKLAFLCVIKSHSGIPVLISIKTNQHFVVVLTVKELLIPY